MPLDASQKAFIQAPRRSNIRLLAPAGCGKTLCLLHRCKRLERGRKARRNRFLILTVHKGGEMGTGDSHSRGLPVCELGGFG